jgi:hypothetical protein
MYFMRPYLKLYYTGLTVLVELTIRGQPVLLTFYGH